MRSVVLLVVACCAGVALGLASAWLALERGAGFGRTVAGAWVGSVRAGGVGADPYTQAVLARTGELPLGGGEGATFTALRDDAGEPLDGGCDYRLAAEPLPARWWTLTPYTADGRLLRTATGRNGITSGEIVRRADGGFDILAAAGARSGNWLPLASGGGPFQLVLRLYDTPLAATASSAAPAMPAILREQCR